MRNKQLSSGLCVFMILMMINLMACVGQAHDQTKGNVELNKDPVESHMHQTRNHSNLNMPENQRMKEKQETPDLYHVKHKDEADKQDVKDNAAKTIKDDVKGIYLNKIAMKEDNIQSYINLIKQTDLNTVVMDVKDDNGMLTYESDIDAVRKINADKDRTVDNMQKLVQRLKKEGIYTIARIVVFKDSYLASQKPELAIRKKDGSIWKDSSGVQWIDPYKEEIWKYVTDISKEVATLGFDEIQYDYIRFPENAKEIDKIVAYDNQDNQSKSDNITAFLKFSNDALREYPINTSADVFGLVTSANDDMGIGQKWEKIAPYVDFISPMTYPSHYGPGIYGLKEPNDHPYELVKHALKDAVKRNQKLDDGAIIRPWVQDFNLKRTYTPEDIKGQIKAIDEQGITQYLIWNAASEYTKEAYQ